MLLSMLFHNVCNPFKSFAVYIDTNFIIVNNDLGEIFLGESYSNLDYFLPTTSGKLNQSIKRLSAFPRLVSPRRERAGRTSALESGLIRGFQNHIALSILSQDMVSGGVCRHSQGSGCKRSDGGVHGNLVRVGMGW